MVNPIKSAFTTFFSPSHSQELDEAKVELEKFILHNPVSVFTSFGDSKDDHTNDEAVNLLLKDFPESLLGVYDVNSYKDPAEMTKAVSIRAYDRNNNHSIPYPQIYIAGEHIGSLKDLEKRRTGDDWPRLIENVCQSLKKSEPVAAILTNQ